MTLTTSIACSEYRQRGARRTSPLALCVPGPEGDRAHALLDGPTTVGGGPRCDLRIGAEGVRPLHCVITCQDGVATVRRWAGDTRLNGQEFTERVLEVGDCLSLGAAELVVVPNNQAPSEGDSRAGLADATEATDGEPLLTQLTEEAQWDAATDDVPPPSEHQGGGWETDAYGPASGEPEGPSRRADDSTRPSSTLAIRRRARNLLRALRERQRADAQKQEDLEQLDRERQELLERVACLQRDLDESSAAARQLEGEREQMRQAEEDLRASHESTLSELQQLQSQLAEQSQIGEELAALRDNWQREREERDEELARLRAELEGAEANAPSHPDGAPVDEPEPSSPRAETVPMGDWSHAAEAPIADSAVDDACEPAPGPAPTDAGEPPVDGDDIPWDMARTCPLPLRTPDEQGAGYDVDESPAEDIRRDPGASYELEESDAPTDSADADTRTFTWSGGRLSDETPESDPHGPVTAGPLDEPPVEATPEDPPPSAPPLMREPEDETSAWLTESEGGSSEREAADHETDALSTTLVGLRPQGASDSSPDGPTSDGPGAADCDAPGALPGEHDALASCEAPTSYYEQYSHLLPPDDADATNGLDDGQWSTPPPEAAPRVAPTEGANEDDIEAYMAQLMQRMRGEAAEPPAPAAPPRTPPQLAAPAAVEPGPTETGSAPPPSGLGQLKRGPAPEQMTDMGSLRALANQSARHAIDTAASRINLEKAIANLVIAVIAVASGVFLIMSAPAIYSGQLLAGAFASLLAGVWGYRSIAFLIASARASARRASSRKASQDVGELPIKKDAPSARA